MIVDNLMKHEMDYSNPSMLTEPKKMFMFWPLSLIILSNNYHSQKKSQFQPPFKS